MFGTCSISDCDAPGTHRAQIKWAGFFGPGTWGLTKPQAFCHRHARSLMRAAPEGAVWLDDPDESTSD